MAISDQTYQLNLSRVGRWLINRPNRKPVIALIMEALLTPLIALHDYFLRYRSAKLYQILITPQVCYLEMLLNDRYDFTQRRIYINDAEWHLPIYIYTPEELKPVGLYTEGEDSPLALYTDSEAGELKDDFVVFVPAGLDFNENEMKSLLNQYKLAGTHYKIEVV